MFDKLIDILIEWVGYFKFWRVIPVNKIGVKIRLGKNPKELNPGFHLVLPFDIDYVKTVIVKSEIVSTESVHITTTDFKTVLVAPLIKYKIIDAIAWLYGVNDAPSNLHDTVRFCTADHLTDLKWDDCMDKKEWTKIKNKIKDKAVELGIEIEYFGLIDLATIKIVLTKI